MNAGTEFGIWTTDFLGKNIVINDIDHTITVINKRGHRTITEYDHPITIDDLEVFKADMAEIELNKRVHALCS